MERWREKAIDQLKKSSDPQIQIAIRILTEGKGYLTCQLPIQIIFFKDIDSDAVK